MYAQQSTHTHTKKNFSEFSVYYVYNAKTNLVCKKKKTTYRK